MAVIAPQMRKLEVQKDTENFRNRGVNKQQGSLKEKWQWKEHFYSESGREMKFLGHNEKGGFGKLNTHGAY